MLLALCVHITKCIIQKTYQRVRTIAFDPTEAAQFNDFFNARPQEDEATAKPDDNHMAVVLFIV